MVSLEMHCLIILKNDECSFFEWGKDDNNIEASEDIHGNMMEMEKILGQLEAHKFKMDKKIEYI